MERVPDIKNLLEKYNLSYGLRSCNDKFSCEIDVIILDTLGELKKMYSICHLAFIGGSFNKTGGHNPLEARFMKSRLCQARRFLTLKTFMIFYVNPVQARLLKLRKECLSILKIFWKTRRSMTEQKRLLRKCLRLNAVQ